MFRRLRLKKQRYGNLILTPEQQGDFVSEQPGIVVSIASGSGRRGATHITNSKEILIQHTRDAGTDFLSLR
jgi:hypothetical protein